MKQEKKLIAMAVIAGLLLPGCSSYQKRSIDIFKQRPANYVQTINNVTMKISKLTQEECEQIFGKRAHNLTLGQSGINPLVLSIENNSATRWELAEKNINLQLTEPEEVAQRLKINTASYAGGIFGKGLGISILAGIGVAATLLITVFSKTAIIREITLAPAGVIQILAIASAPFIIAGVIISAITATGHASHSLQNNQFIDEITNKATINASIKPNKTLSGLLFVNKPNYTSEFTITLQEKTDHSNSMTFNVVLYS